MNNYLDLSIVEINKLLKEKKIKVVDLINEALERIEKSNLNAFITLNKEEALKRAEELDKKEVDNILFGIPIAIKDNICTKNLRTTCASKMLEDFIPIYNATVIDNINSKNMVIIGKTNMDEFAMGSTSETSYFHSVKNPIDDTKVSGGSSGGSAASIGGGMAILSLGSDTGGSIRQPSSYCGIVGMKPTYGLVSRYGLIAFSSTLDQIGPMTRNVYENALLLNAIKSYDYKDSTSVKTDKDFTKLIGEDIKNKKVAVLNYGINNVSEYVKKSLLNVIEILKNNNVEVEYIDLDYIEYATVIYQIIAMGEASSNLARFDGTRFGYSYKEAKDIKDLYSKSRGYGFGDEVKRRIMIGSYILSGDNAKEYYDKALIIRNSYKESFNNIFKKYDFVLTPTTSTTAYNLNSTNITDFQKEVDDNLVIPVNMAGLPALSMPMGKYNNLPLGLQIIGNYFEEDKIYQLADFIEKNVEKVGEINE